MTLFEKTREFHARHRLAASLLIVGVLAVAVCGLGLIYSSYRSERAELFHYERDETELVVTNLANAKIALFRAGNSLADAAPVDLKAEGSWLTRGNYFLEAEIAGKVIYYPVPIQGYQSGTDVDGRYAVTIRPLPGDQPPAPLPAKEYAFIPSGHFLFGNKNNPFEPHYVWTQGFFIGRFEVSNEEFRQFLNAPDGYRSDDNWTAEGRNWKKKGHSGTSGELTESDEEYRRFGQPDQPVNTVNWYEATAYCRWLTRKFGGGRWIYSLPNEAEWEKAARGPDNFDYPLAQYLSDAETAFYNWKKNPLAEVTVVGTLETSQKFRPNRYGIYHMGGNVVEWTQGLYRAFNRDKPYDADDGRNREDETGVRVVRGGSWYSASSALLYIPYRDTFQPEISHNDLGFRVVVRSLMH